MTIAASTVKRLRDKTGAGMMDCKKALQAAAGDVDGAVQWLRKQGIAKAAAKVGRTASEGIIVDGRSADGRLVVLAEVNCETDFVVKTEDFQQFAQQVAQVVLMAQPADRAALLASAIGQHTVADVQTAITAKIGENIHVGRFVYQRLTTTTQKIAKYIHAGSKIAVLVAFDDPEGQLSEAAGKDVAMHVAAMNPSYLRRSEVPAATLAQEKDILRAQMTETNKPAEILDKILTGKLGKFFSEQCLEEQVFVKDPSGKQTVGQALQQLSAQIRIISMSRLQVGEQATT